jgi:hypothetical protein
VELAESLRHSVEAGTLDQSVRTMMMAAEVEVMELELELELVGDQKPDYEEEEAEDRRREDEMAVAVGYFEVAEDQASGVLAEVWASAVAHALSEEAVQVTAANAEEDCYASASHAVAF